MNCVLLVTCSLFLGVVWLFGCLFAVVCRLLCLWYVAYVLVVCHSCFFVVACCVLFVVCCVLAVKCC